VREHWGIAGAVAVMTATFLIVLGSMVVVLGWIGLSIYALVKAIGSAPDSANPTVVVLLFVGLVTVFTVLLAVTIALVGRAMTPRKRKDRRVEQLALELEP
jgi:hypothetical protein